MEPAMAITRYCRKLQLKNHPMPAREGTQARACGVYELRAFKAMMKSYISQRSLRLSLVNIHMRPPKMAMLARIIIIMSLLHLLRVIPR